MEAATVDLDDDHNVLRATLALLEEWLPALRVTPATIRIIVVMLAERVHVHTHRVEAVVGPRVNHLDALSLARLQLLHDDHQRQRMQLAVLHELLIGGTTHAMEQAVVEASELIDGVREHMAREARELCPAIERSWGVMTQEPGEADQPMHDEFLVRSRTHVVGAGT